MKMMNSIIGDIFDNENTVGVNEHLAIGGPVSGRLSGGQGSGRVFGDMQGDAVGLDQL